MRTGISWLDFKLGARMLVKYPGLTLVGGLGMAVAIAIGTGFFLTLSAVLSTLPLDQGERVVAIQSWDAAANEKERRILHDFAEWRAELRTVEELGAFRTVGRNLIGSDGLAEPVALAEITASAFHLARVPPLLGRPLLEEDERAGAPPVVVIGHDVWRNHFASDPGTVGRELRLGGVVHSVVGVMPEGYGFPVNHRFWVPLRADPTPWDRRQGPELMVFGRLAPGVTLEQAQAELTTLGRRAAAVSPQTHERLVPRVVPYTHAFFGLDQPGAAWALRLLLLLMSLLLVVVCTNVAVLVYARTAARAGEVAVRSALGASRGRIVAQMFVEALVLAAGAAALGLGIVGLVVEPLRQVVALQEGGVPFWMEFRLTPGTLLYVLGLTMLASVIVGVLPGLQATGQRMQATLRQLGGGTGMQLGRTWSVLIVAQVAFAVAVLPGAVFTAWEYMRYGITGPGFAAEEYLTARLEMEREPSAGAEAEAYEGRFAARYGDRLAELERRLEAEPGVSAVTFALDVPGAERTAWIEVEGVTMPSDRRADYAVGAGSASGHTVRYLSVDGGFFDAFRVPVLTGRGFHPGELDGGAAVVIVNRTFVQELLNGGSALGRRVRYVGLGASSSAGAQELGAWHEVVGVVGDLPANAIEPDLAEARMYHPLVPGRIHPVSLALRMHASTPASFGGRLREITTTLDPTLQLHEVLPLDEVYRRDRGLLRVGALAFALVTLSVLLLSAAGIHALMSFTVTRRRREIGIRSALGADPRRILQSVFSRALGQLATGVALGTLAAGLLELLTDGAVMEGHRVVLLPAVSMLMLLVGLLAALGPARRGLRIQPTEALRADG